MIGPIRWGNLQERSHFEMPEVPVLSRRLPQAFEGFRIAVIADLHLGPLVGPDFLRRALERLCGARPDLVLLVGDLVERPGGSVKTLARALRPVCSRFLTCAVMGNHDYWYGLEAFRPAMAAAGVDILINEHRLLRRGPGGHVDDSPGIALLGLDDYLYGSPDFARAADGIENGTFTILAAHHPDQADALPPDPGVDLMLCGHTHGGQIRLFGKAPVTYTKNKRYLSGLIRGPGFPMYISRGLGCTTIPLRIGADPELPIITLRRGP